MLVDKELFRTSQFVHLFKVNVLNLHVIMIKLWIKMLILAAILCWIYVFLCGFKISLKISSHRYKREEVVWAHA